MSNDVPPSAPGSPEPDPFAELLRGLINEPASDGSASSAAEPELPPTEALPSAELPPTEAMPAVQPPSTTFPPTAAFPPDATFPPTGVTEPTAATRVFQPAMAYPQAEAAPGEPTEILGGLGGLAGFGHVPPDDPATASWSLGDEERAPLDARRKVLVGILIAVAAVLVVAIAVLVTILAIGNGSGAPVASHSSSHAPSLSPDPSETASESPSPSATPAEPLAIASFAAAAATVQCPYDRSGAQQVVLDWSVTGAANVAVASAATEVDATQQPYESNLDPEVTGFAMPYVCTNAKWTYTLTITGEDGTTQSQAILITAEYAAPPQPTQPPPAHAAIQSFAMTDDAAALCAAAPASAGGVVDLAFSWTTTNANQAGIGIDVADGIDDGGPVDANGSTTEQYQCGAPHTYVLTVVGPDGQHVSKTLSVSS